MQLCRELKLQGTMTYQLSDMTNPLTIYENVNKLYQYLPAGVYTAASIVAGIITPTGKCEPIDRKYFLIVIVGFFTLASCFISGVMHRTVTPPPHWGYTAGRVVGVADRKSVV